MVDSSLKVGKVSKGASDSVELTAWLDVISVEEAAMVVGDDAPARVQVRVRWLPPRYWCP